MPIYEYECLACKTRFERAQRFSDPPVGECPECGGSVRRVLFPAGILFKGSGWYITDSRQSTPSETSTSTAAPKGESKGETAPAKSEAVKSESAGSTAGKGKAE